METTFEAAFDKAVETSTGEQSQDQAPVKTDQAEAAKQTVEEKGKEPAQPVEGSEDLLPQEEWDKLQKDPKALRAALNKAFTEKTQKLSEERKSVESQREALEQYQQLNEQWQSDPRGVIQALAKQAGIDLPSVETQVQAKSAAKSMVDELKESLGPDLEFLAERLAKPLESIILRTAHQAVAPIQQKAAAIERQQIEKDVDTDLARMTEKYPDWKKHEPQMLKLGQVLQPAKDPATGKYPTTMEHLERLYLLSTMDVREAEATKKAIERMNKSMEKSETSEGGVAANRVAKSAPKSGNLNETFDQAWKDARAGIRYE